MVTPLELSRLRHEFEHLGRHADVLVLDAGNTITPALAEFWRMADLVLTLTTTQPLALMGTYALIKSLHTEALRATLVTLVNQSSDEELAERITDKIQEATQRFSGREIEAWPGIPFDPAVKEWDDARRPWWLTARLDPAALALEQLAERCLAVLAEVGTHGRALACA
jgi:flagellar biosynthesis protein FlhG